MTTLSDAIAVARVLRTQLIATYLDSLGKHDLADAIRAKFGSGEEVMKKPELPSVEVIQGQ